MAAYLPGPVGNRFDESEALNPNDDPISFCNRGNAAALVTKLIGAILPPIALGISIDSTHNRNCMSVDCPPSRTGEMYGIFATVIIINSLNIFHDLYEIKKRDNGNCTSNSCNYFSAAFSISLVAISTIYLFSKTVG